MFTRIESPRIGRSDIRVTRIALGIALVSLAGLLGVCCYSRVLFTTCHYLYTEYSQQQHKHTQ